MNTGANGEPASHGEMPSRQPTQTPQDRVGSALLMKDQVVSAVVMAAESLGGSPRRELLRLSDQIAYATDAEAIYRNPLALEVFLPLIDAPRKSDGADRRVHQDQVDELVCS